MEGVTITVQVEVLRPETARTQDDTKFKSADIKTGATS